MAGSPDEIRKHLKTYWFIGAALFFFTCVTLLLGGMDLGAPGIGFLDISIGLLVASAKTSLVMLIFMHLNHERGLIYKVLLFTLAFSISLMGLTLFAQADPIPEHSHIIDRVDQSQVVDPAPKHP